MLEKIWNVIKNLGKVISALTEFIFDMVEDLIYMIRLLGDVVDDIPQYLGFFPSVIVTVVTTCIGLAVIFKVLGREG